MPHSWGPGHLTASARVPRGHGAPQGADGAGGAGGHHGNAAHTDIKQSFISEVAKPQRVTAAAAPALPHTPQPCPTALPHNQPCHTPPALSCSLPHGPLPHRLSHNPPAPLPALPHRLPHTPHTHLPPSSGAGQAPQCPPVPPRVPRPFLVPPHIWQWLHIWDRATPPPPSPAANFKHETPPASRGPPAPLRVGHGTWNMEWGMWHREHRTWEQGTQDTEC